MVVACGARYEVGHTAGVGGLGATDGDGGTGSGAAGGVPVAGGAGRTGAGGRTGTGGDTGQSGSGAQAGTGATGGAINQAGGATAVAGASTGLPACIQETPVPRTFELAEPIEMWRRLTTFLYSEPFPPPRDLPRATSFSWVGETALKMLHGELTDADLPAGAAPVLANLLASWIPDRVAAAHYAEPLLAAGATLPSLWSAPDPNEPHRIGLLTDPSFLSAYPSISARGAWMSQHVFCWMIPPPPADVQVLPADEPGLTRRQELMAAVATPSCAGCHALVDPLGFSLEHFDELGEFRTVDDGQPIDSSGQFVEANLSFADVEELAKQLADSCFVGQCFSRQVWTDAVERARQEPAPLERWPGELDTVLLKFASDRYSIDALISAVVTSPSFAGTQ